MATKETSNMWKEIHEQPEAVRNCIEKNRDVMKSIARQVKQRDIKTVVFAARGSSDHACLIARYVFEIYCGMVASIACPSVVTQYSNTMDYSNVLLIGVSQSGGAADVYEVMKKCHGEGGICVSVTNVRDSLMTKTGSFYMNNECGPELSITAAKSYLTQTAMLIGIAAYISGSSELMNLLTRLPDIVASSMELEPQVEHLLPLYRNVEHLMIYGRGYLAALGMETELKIQETSYLDARCYASSDYRHGPIATAQRFVPCIFFIADKETNKGVIELHQRLKEEKKIFSTIVTNDKEIAAMGDSSVLIPGDCDGLAAVFPCAVFSQMFACLCSMSRGYNPDNPDGVSKNTVTI